MAKSPTEDSDNNIIDHPHHVVVVGAGGAGSRATSAAAIGRLANRQIYPRAPPMRPTQSAEGGNRRQVSATTRQIMELARVPDREGVGCGAERGLIEDLR